MAGDGDLSECRHCGCSHFGTPGRCDITPEMVVMAANYVRRHPGTDKISAAQGITGGRDIAPGYRAVNTAVREGLIRWVPLEEGDRLFAVRTLMTPFPLTPGEGHEPFPGPRDVLTGNNGYSVRQAAWSPSIFDRTAFPVSGHCAVCSVSIGRAAPWTAWHHCGVNCPECMAARSGAAPGTEVR